VPDVGGAGEARVLDDGVRVVHVELEPDHGAALLFAAAGEDLLADPEVRLPPGQRLLGVGQGEADLAHVVEDGTALHLASLS
jgi:hypothetical protein